TYNLCKSDFKYLAKTYKIRHYSKKKKKTWYTYYTPGGAHYATAEAKRIMAAVPDPVMPGGGTSCTKDNGTFDGGTSTVPLKKDASTTTVVKTAPKTSTTSTVVRQTIPAGATYYTIKSGDTLYALALKNNTTVAKLCALNNISSSATLHIGQKIRLK
ncbi:MAG TPA: LysM domain-containing protein, partial [Bacteroidia bacterium]|nr:LysM domain-containing protein [Bacteroidia bacterium]